MVKVILSTAITALLTAVLLQPPSYRQTTPGFFTVETEGPQGQVDSPMFRGNAAHTGYYPHGLGTQQPGEDWNAIVYVGSEDGHLYALESSKGEELWKVQTTGPIRSSLTAVEGVVYVGSIDTYLYALDAKTGQELWKTETDGAIHSCPAIAAWRTR